MPVPSFLGSVHFIQIILPTGSCNKVQHSQSLEAFFSFTVKMALSEQCKALLLEWKVALIKEVEKGGRSKFSTAKEFGLASLTLSTVLKNKERVIDWFERSFSNERKRTQNSSFQTLKQHF